MVRIQNVEWCKDTLGRAEHVGKGEALLEVIPRPHGRCREHMAVGMLDEPAHEQRVEQADERCDPLDGGARSGRRLGEAEFLLEIAEAHFNRPPTGVALEDLADRAGGIGAEEDAVSEAAGGHLDDDNAEQPAAAGAIPLREQLLVTDRAPAPVEVGSMPTAEMLLSPGAVLAAGALPGFQRPAGRQRKAPIEDARADAQQSGRSDAGVAPR
jgi:hypothetical protein